MRVWITGVTGFLGSHLAEHLLACGDQVLGTSRSGRWPPWLNHLRSRVPLLSWDLRRPVPAPVWDAVASFAPQAVYHLAALSLPDRCGSREPTAEALAVNVEGTRHVCQVAWQLSPRPRLLLASSGHVYCSPPRFGYRLDERSPLEPRNGYGRSKLLAEQVLGRHAAAGLPAVVVRSFNHAGPRQDRHLMLAQWCWQLAAGQQRLVVRNRNTWLDLLDVRDAARAYRAVMLQGSPGLVYNVGAGTAVCSGWVLKLLLQRAGARVSVEETSPGLRRNPVADTSRLARHTGWCPRVPLRQTVDDCLRFYRQWAEAFPAAEQARCSGTPPPPSETASEPRSPQ